MLSCETTFRSEDRTMAEQTCTKCAMPKRNWKANEGKGYAIQGRDYCCRGCAEGTGCTCE